MSFSSFSSFQYLSVILEGNCFSLLQGKWWWECGEGEATMTRPGPSLGELFTFAGPHEPKGLWTGLYLGKRMEEALDCSWFHGHHPVRKWHTGTAQEVLTDPTLWSYEPQSYSMGNRCYLHPSDASSIMQFMDWGAKAQTGTWPPELRFCLMVSAHWGPKGSQEQSPRVIS